MRKMLTDTAPIEGNVMGYSFSKEQIMKHSQSTAALTATDSLLAFLKENVLKGSNLRVSKVDDSQLWLETLDEFVSLRLIMCYETRQILYDIFSPKCDLHLKEETVEDVERLDSVAEIKGKWKYEKSIEDLWFVLDWIRVWARKDGFVLKKVHLM
jgi:hypothetical protein